LSLEGKVIVQTGPSHRVEELLAKGTGAMKWGSMTFHEAGYYDEPKAIFYMTLSMPSNAIPSILLSDPCIPYPVFPASHPSIAHEASYFVFGAS